MVLVGAGVGGVGEDEEVMAFLPEGGGIARGDYYMPLVSICPFLSCMVYP